MVNYTYPHVDVNVIDASTAPSTTTASTANPLHCPFFFVNAEKGPINTPVENDISGHESVFGSRTFDPTSEFWTLQNLYAMKAAAGQKVFLIRLADDSVATASLVVEMTATKGQIPVYKTDTEGNRIVSNGAYVQETGTDGTATTQSGWTLSFSKRTLAAGESYNTIGKTVLAVDANKNPTSVKIPLLGIVGTSAGSALNRDGLLLYSNRSVGNEVSSSGVQSAWLRFAPVSYAYNSNVYSANQDLYGQNYNDVSLKASAVNSVTKQDVSLSKILSTNYVDLDGNNLLDYDVFVYSSLISSLMTTLNAAGDNLSDPMDIDLFTGLKPDGTFCEFIQVDTSSLTTAGLNSSLVPAMLSGGTDGSVGPAALETQIQAFIAGGANTEFLDVFRYPFTHFYDSGFTFETKESLVTLLSLRDDIKGDWSTQDISQSWNTQAQDVSAGTSLATRLQTSPESALYGTDAMRASIYMQCGVLAESSAYGSTVPATYARLLKRVSTDSGSTVRGTIKGRPGSEVTYFKSLNWLAATPTQKQIAWDACLNQICSASRNVQFFPDYRSIYTDQTSLLSDDIMVDKLIYIKHIVRDVWTYYSGRDDARTTLNQQIARDIANRIATAFSSTLNCTVTVEETELDALNGYSSTIIVSVVGDSPMRVWNVQVPVSRNTSDVTASATSSSTTTNTTGTGS